MDLYKFSIFIKLDTFGSVDCQMIRGFNQGRKCNGFEMFSSIIQSRLACKMFTNYPGIKLLQAAWRWK